MKFTIFTHVEHQQENKELFAYAPYVREMNLWFQFVEEVEVVAPLSSEKEISVEIPYQKKVIFTEIPSIDFLSVKRGFWAFIKIPSIFFSICKAMKRADHIHLRCPGNIGLLACIVQVFFPRKPKTAKYAGNWDPNAKQPWTYNLQKWILSNTFLSRNMKVLVYGEWPDQSKNIVSFFTASFSEKEIPVPEKVFREPFLFLFVGNLVSGKQPLFAIQLVEELNKRNYPVMLEIYGDGILKVELEKYCTNNNLEKNIIFKGNQPLDQVKEAYKKAHFLVLASKSEGWPKAVAEAMFFGVIPVATAVSCIPWMLDYGRRGILIEGEIKKTKRRRGENRSEKAKRGERKVVDFIIELLEDPEEMEEKSNAAKAWSQQYTLEKFEAGIKEVIC